MGAVDEDYRLVFADVVLPVLRQFEPGLVLVSAGFDAHERDPLGGMRLTTPAFAAMTMELRRVAEAMLRRANGGGHGRRLRSARARRVAAAVTEVLGPEQSSPAAWPKAGPVSPTRGRTAVAAAKSALSPFWRF